MKSTEANQSVTLVILPPQTATCPSFNIRVDRKNICGYRYIKETTWNDDGETRTTVRFMWPFAILRCRTEHCSHS